MEPDEAGRGLKGLPDVGFRSKASKQLLDYLQSTQKCQLKLICLRVSSNVCVSVYALGGVLLFSAILLCMV